MWLLILEALAALALLGFAVWWTMFSDRRRRDEPGEPDKPKEPNKPNERDPPGA